jgi:protein phosphatase
MAAVDAAHSGVISAADAPRGVKGMGATLCAGVFGTVGEAPSMAIVNVGDSRAYLAREGEPLRLLTKDQRWVQTQVDAGVLTPEEARVHSHRNILTSVVGGVGAYNPSVEYITPRTGDKFIFCTDGITEELSDELFERSIQTAANFEQLAKELVKAVLEGSARDNATVLVVSVLESPQLSA